MASPAKWTPFMFHFLSCLHRSVSPFPLQFLNSISSCTAKAPTLTYSPPPLGSVALLPTARYCGSNSGGDEIGFSCCSGWSTPAKVVSVSRQLITYFLLTVRVLTFSFQIGLFIHTYIYFLTPLPFGFFIGPSLSPASRGALISF